GLVPQGEGEDAVEPVEERSRRVLAVQRVDHLAVGGGPERVRLAQFVLQQGVVVDLAVHRQRQFAILRQQRLRAAGRVDDGQALVHQDRKSTRLNSSHEKNLYAVF